MSQNTLEQLEKIIAQRAQNASQENSYTAKLLEEGLPLINKKIIEEAGEIIMATTEYQANQHTESVTHEIADLLFHVLIVMNYCNISLQDVYNELNSRRGTSGITEKNNRNNTHA